MSGELSGQSHVPRRENDISKLTFRSSYKKIKQRID